MIRVHQHTSEKNLVPIDLSLIFRSVKIYEKIIYVQFQIFRSFENKNL